MGTQDAPPLQRIELPPSVHLAAIAMAYTKHVPPAAAAPVGAEAAAESAAAAAAGGCWGCSD